MISSLVLVTHFTVNIPHLAGWAFVFVFSFFFLLLLPFPFFYHFLPLVPLRFRRTGSFTLDMMADEIRSERDSLDDSTIREVKHLARTISVMSGQSSVLSGKSSSVISGNSSTLSGNSSVPYGKSTGKSVSAVAISNPFKGATADESLDPLSGKFSYSKWVRTVLRLTSRDPDRYPTRTSGISFSDLNAYGYGSTADFQKTVGNVFLDIPSIIAGLFGRRQGRRVDILRNFEGVVRDGEMLLVLGPPGR